MTTMMKTRQVTRRDAHEAVADRQNFRYNRSASGEWTSRVTNFGQLNESNARGAKRFLDAADESFVVFSYQTPIAIWNSARGWWITSQTFSRTTSTHQGFVRRGMSH